jgi:plasmid stabilization system protein ParE
MEAARYYESQVPALGAAFLKEVRRASGAIASYPEAAAIVRGHTRRRLLRRFPYGVLYRVDPQEIVVVAVMHLRRKPGYWLGRV